MTHIQTEKIVEFQCKENYMCGVLHLPKENESSNTGVLIVVGGPQYRVGSHRQFVLLARYLSENGYPVFRFDYRSMGDSEGEARDFESVGEDISTAIEAFFSEAGQLSNIVIWGLCDAASAALFVAHSIVCRGFVEC